ncbi:methyl-accepting chemotaxis protein [Halopseudomonas nanhaiensis]|uniref:methyl-accepting chemotaxis protein n=1 Tax=Halopseudomonas nanhaiensis TaxID=2830842 RepID=UPI001CBCDF68|nr:methyl-accepting chemotaxis protein [Halopseudomonas nanhaiensis]UAW99327.1 methyl-accepting chemotaxis protein [Halopseudomonas nanhaiensis]
MNLRNFSIATRLAAGFAVIALIVVLLGMLATREMGEIRDDVVLLEETWVPGMQQIGAFNQNYLRFRIYTMRVIMATNPADIGPLREELANLQKNLIEAENAFDSLTDDPTMQRAFDVYRQGRVQYMAVQEQIVQLAADGRDVEAEAMLTERLNPIASTVTAALIDLERKVAEGADTAARRALDVYAAAFRQTVAFIIAAVLLTIALAYLITRSIVAPIREAVEASEVVAAGDLTRTIKSVGKDESARLLQALATMQLQLRNTIQGIANSSNQLAAAAEELNAVTEDASRGLQRQNDEVQQAATAVNEMTAAVEEVARNAVSTSEQSKETSQIAGEGQQQVSRTVTSIDKLSGTIQSTATEVQELADKAQNISRVLDVIRAIAEQTNLLALNAAIEAARAGEQGRGFAVVADEVRALAHRTQQSTTEIEEMIGTIQQGTERAVEAMGISKTMAGSTLEQATAAGEALTRITSAIVQINERNLVIASASEEQAAVAREVDRNLVNIRDLSTQSAAGAEQTSSSSRELSRLAVELNDLVNRFRI